MRARATDVFLMPTTFSYSRAVLTVLAACAILPSMWAQSGRIGFSTVANDPQSNGATSLATGTRLEDATKSWSMNMWSGYYVQVVDASGRSCIRRIAGNSSNALEISDAFDGTIRGPAVYRIRRAYRASSTGLRLRLFLQYDDGGDVGGRLNAYSCRVQASDTAAVEFTSVERGGGMAESWSPNYFVPAGAGRVNWVVFGLSQPRPLATGLYHLATVDFNLRSSEADELISFTMTNTPQGDLPMGILQNNGSISLDTASGVYSSAEEIIVLHDLENGRVIADGASSVEEGPRVRSYPNPFNPATTLQYELTENADVKLVVYDMLGREIEALVNTTQYAGLHSVVWAPQAVSSGTYLGRLTVTGHATGRTRTTAMKLTFAK